MYLYCTKKALAKSVHDWTFSRLNWLYHLVADLVKLSWKQWISSLSLLVWLVIFRQYMYRCADGHFGPSYLSKVGILNFGGSTRSGTRLILLASTRLYVSDPSTILTLQWARVFVRPQYFQIAPTIHFLSSIVLLDHRGSKLLLGQPYLPLSSVLLRASVSEEASSRMGTLPLEAWAAFAHMEKWIPADRQDLAFFYLSGRHYFTNLLPVLYPSPTFLTFSSSLPFAPIGLSGPFPTTQS